MTCLFVCWCQESAEDEETLESLYESMTGLMKMLREPEAKEKKGTNIHIIFMYSFLDGLSIFKDFDTPCKLCLRDI